MHCIIEDLFVSTLGDPHKDETRIWSRDELLAAGRFPFIRLKIFVEPRLQVSDSLEYVQTNFVLDYWIETGLVEGRVLVMKINC